MISINVFALLGIILLVALIMIGCVVVGAFIMFKGKQTGPQAGFFGGVPKGEAFSIPEAEDALGFPDDSNIVDKTKAFLEKLGGDVNASPMS